MTKIVAIWYRTAGRPGRHEVVSVDNNEGIKPAFGRLLFDRHANSLLVNYDNKMYVIEPANRENALYVKRLVNYHPLSQLVAS